MKNRSYQKQPLRWLAIAAGCVLLITAISNAENRVNLSTPTVKVTDVMSPLGLRQVNVGGEFGRRIDITVKNNLLAIDIEKDFLAPFRGKHYTGLNDGSGPFVGLGNLINSTVCLAAHTENEALLARKKHLVEETLKSQEPDGYIGMLPPEKRTWSLWDIHEQGYIIHGLVADYRLFGEERSLDAARKLADYLIRRWPTKPSEWDKTLVCAETIAITGFERSILVLYGATGEARYLDFCVQQLKTAEWNLDIVLGRRWPILGHVYSYLSHCLAQLELHRFQPADQLLVPTRRAMDFMIAQDCMVITGAAGSQHECWTDDQNGRGSLGETCATAYQIFVYDSLLRLQGDPLWGDLMDRTLYNAAFGAQSPDGRRLRYYVPFEGDRVYFGADSYCCPNNFRRLIAIIPQLIYYKTDKGIVVNLYTPSQATLENVGGATFVIRQETDYPSSGRVTLHVEPSQPATFPLLLRIPRWCAKATVAINGKPGQASARTGSFLKIEREWKRGDTVALELPMEWRIIAGRKTQAGRAAIMRGPVIYTFNPSMNPDIDTAKIDRIVLIPSSLELVSSDSVRPGGTACRVKGDYAKADKGALTITLTEFPDPDGKWIYFLWPDPSVAVDDELVVAAR